VRYFSMFSGIGGFELGIQRAIDKNRKQESIGQGAVGEHIQRQGAVSNNNGSRLQPNKKQGHRILDGVCIGYSEIDKYADQIYQKHFGGHNHGDATKINAGELPDFDLLVGGFPCQAFSVAGKRAGFNDTRGTLFFDIARILKEKQPRNLVLENVKGLLSHDGGRTFTTILGVLADLGYFVEWQVLNSKDFGVPQNRERVFIVGHLGGQPRRKVFLIKGGSSQVKSAIHPALDANYYKGPSNQRRMINQLRIRRLTPLECERLQGFPDNWTALGVGDEPISDTQRYKMCGNAVTTNVVTAVMTNLRRVM